MGQDIDYAAVIADLENRRNTIDNTIAFLRGLVDGGGVVGAQAQMSSLLDLKREKPESREVVPGLFHGLSVAAAARKFLEMKRSKQRMVDIVSALQQGGIESEAGNFYSNVFTTISRKKDFTRLGKYWALAEWYPNRPVVTAKKGGKKKRPGKKSSSKAAAAKEPSLDTKSAE